MTIRLFCTLNLLLLGFRAFWLESHCSNLLYPREKCLTMHAVHFGKNFQNFLGERECVALGHPHTTPSKCTLVSWELQSHAASSSSIWFSEMDLTLKCLFWIPMWSIATHTSSLSTELTRYRFLSRNGVRLWPIPEEIMSRLNSFSDELNFTYIRNDVPF